jgi:hypothetical protein
MVFAFLYPFIHPELSFSSPVEIPGMVRNNLYLPLITVTGNAVKHFSWIKLISAAYYSGVAISLIIFVMQLIKISFLIIKSKKEIMDGNLIIMTKKNYSPFSFFKYIFIPENRYDKIETMRIILHEKKHVTEYHTADLILYELVKALQWFNPFVYLYEKELHAIHEYTADEAVILSGINKNEYLSLLLFNTSDSITNKFGNNFSTLLTKKRIKMIMETKRKSSAWIKLMPAIALTICLLAAHTSCSKQATDKLEKMKTTPSGEETDDVLRIRGNNKANVVYIIDGKVVDDISNIKTTTIESITVIKNKDMFEIFEKKYGVKVVDGIVEIISKDKEKETLPDDKVFDAVEQAPDKTISPAATREKDVQGNVYSLPDKEAGEIIRSIDFLLSKPPAEENK